MQGNLFDPTVGHLFLIIIAILLFAHAYVLMRIRNILQAISMNFDTITYFCRKFSASATQEASKSTARKTCQFCRHRLAYINTTKSRSEEEDFYHICGLTNAQIKLADSCESFEEEDGQNPGA